jgi:hypothetical protein
MSERESDEFLLKTQLKTQISTLSLITHNLPVTIIVFFTIYIRASGWFTVEWLRLPGFYKRRR